MSKVKLTALAAFGAFVLSGPLQHVGALPQTSVGDSSKAMLKMARDTVVPPAFGACGFGNNGVGNGLDPQPRGNPPINDGPGTAPGNPGNRGGA